jgi:cytoplasmic iron level regulating protein YaaA (DUF328/UPF0246 family)
MPDLEDRVRELERFRYAALGFINAHTTIVSDLWANYIEKVNPQRKLEIAEALQQQWFADANQTVRPAIGADPAHLDLLSQHYQEALEVVGSEILRKLKAAG